MDRKQREQQKEQKQQKEKEKELKAERSRMQIQDSTKLVLRWLFFVSFFNLLHMSRHKCEFSEAFNLK